MRLLILAGEFPPFRGGIATYARELADAATGIGYDVTVAAPDYGADQSRNDASYAFRVLRFSGGESTMRGIVDKLRWTRRLARQEQFDVVHAADWTFFLPVALSAFRRNARCLITFHGTEINQMGRKSRRIALKLAQFWNGWALSVANSRFTGAHLLRTFPEHRPDRIRAIPLGVRPPADRSPKSHDQARAELGIANTDFVVLSLGRVVPRKGHHVTVASFALLPEAMRDRLAWYVVGPEVDRDYMARIKAATAASGVRANFTGALSADALEVVFSAADLFCVPSTWGANGEFEGFGLVYVEAGLRGLASVATTVGGIPDAVIDGETGILVSPDDPVALAAALVQLWEDPVLRTTLATAARRHASENSWAKVAALTYAP